MIPFRQGITLPIVLSGLALAVVTAPPGCATRSDESLGIATAHPDGSTAFVAEAGPGECTEDSGCDAGLVQYCPATGCPFPYATCPTSHFSCDVNLLNDPRNCGGCGRSCYEGASGNATYVCLEGTCKLSCRQGTADCNGLPDDDCETNLGTSNDCTACGDTCPDPAKPCIVDDQGKGKCGCDLGQTYCGDQGCVDTQTSDDNCGACGTICDSTPPDGTTPSAHTYLGCIGGECGQNKCENGWADCDGKPENGCETSMFSATSCGSCTKACDPGQTCRPYQGGKPTCVCPPGKELCGNVCVDTGSDPLNCGACGNDCTLTNALQNGIGYCAYGSCRYGCSQGWGDCNGNPQDGCEINLDSDPRNCGVCGNTCDIAGGQPCIAGRCAVEPCSGGVTTQ